jgi:hypothetical protein
MGVDQAHGPAHRWTCGYQEHTLQAQTGVSVFVRITVANTCLRRRPELRPENGVSLQTPICVPLDVKPDSQRLVGKLLSE